MSPASTTITRAADFLTCPRWRCQSGLFMSAMLVPLCQPMNGVMRRPLPPGGGVFVPALLREFSMYHDGTPKPCAALALSLAIVYLLLLKQVGYSWPEIDTPTLYSSSMPSGHLKTFRLLKFFSDVLAPSLS